MLASTGIGSVQLSAGRLEARGAHQRAMRLAYVPEHSVSDPFACFTTHRPSFFLQGSQVARFRGGSTSPLQSSTQATARFSVAERLMCLASPLTLVHVEAEET